ncbi:MAG: VCBS repeat-containing protein [Phycisphaerales bacterium]|nr:VCBS repeat-containing protein [Phycisphaerales bacterium]
MKRFLAISLALVLAGCSSHKKDKTDAAPSQDTDAGATSNVATASGKSLGPAPVTYAPFMKNLPEDGMWKCDPLLFDNNGDGVLDLAIVPRLRVKDLGDGPRFWFGNKQGEWKQASDGLDTGEHSCGGGIDTADINNDGFADLAVADHCQGVFVYLGDGEGNWKMVTRAMYPSDVVAEPERLSMYVGAEDLDLGDLNGDGFIDIAVGASDLGGINVYLGDGTGENWKRVETGLPDTEWATRVELADFNKDGSLDVVSSFSDGPRVWLNDGTGHFTAGSEGLPSPIMRGIYTGLDVGDFNMDGRLDFAIANWVDGPEVYMQTATGAWEKAPDVFPDMLGGAIGLDVGDLNGDGKPDLAVAGRLKKEGGYVRGVFPLLGDGAGSFKYVDNSGLPNTGLSSTAGVTIADIDGDGIADIAAGSGLLVETAGGMDAPSIPQRLLVWRGTGPAEK